MTNMNIKETVLYLVREAEYRYEGSKEDIINFLGKKIREYYRRAKGLFSVEAKRRNLIIAREIARVREYIASK